MSRALALIAEGALDGDGNGVDKLAERLGLGERHLRRLFLKHLGASPISVAQTRRVLFAKQLIHETRMPMTEVAMASGFGSLRRFNEIFQELFHRPPSALRHEGGDVMGGKGVALRLRYRPPYDWASMLSFLSARAIPGVEAIEEQRYLRTTEIGGEIGGIEVSHLPDQKCLNVRILFPNVRFLPAIVCRVRELFDLNADIETIDNHLAADSILAPLISRRPGLRVPGGWDGFEVGIRAVLGQQITIAAARRYAGQLVETHGRIVPNAARIHPRLTHVFPTAERLAQYPLRLAMPATRLRAAKAVAEAAIADPTLFRPSANIDETVSKLVKIPGVGEWTEHYIALRANRETDAFPVTDAGLLRGATALRGKKTSSADLLAWAESWRPWRAYAAQHIWLADSDRARNFAESSDAFCHRRTRPTAWRAPV